MGVHEHISTSVSTITGTTGFFFGGWIIGQFVNLIIHLHNQSIINYFLTVRYGNTRIYMLALLKHVFLFLEYKRVTIIIFQLWSTPKLKQVLIS